MSVINYLTYSSLFILFVTSLWSLIRNCIEFRVKIKAKKVK